MAGLRPLLILLLATRYQKYSIAGVTFEPPNGTMGLPYHAMKHFQDEVKSVQFENARRRYCLPVMDPHTIKCEEVKVNATTCESVDGKFVKFKSLNVSSYNEETDKSNYMGTGLYKISSPFPASADNWTATKFRTDTQGKGVMIVQNYLEDPYITLIGAADAWDGGYASMLYRLMYDGKNPDISDIPDGGTFDFAAACKMTPILEQDNVGSSWREVDFTLDGGVLRANVTDERCPNARAPNGEAVSGFADLNYALEGAAAVLSSTDGYSKSFNEHAPSGAGSNVFANMSRLDAIINQIYHISQTAWTESAYEYALMILRSNRATYHDDQLPAFVRCPDHLDTYYLHWPNTSFAYRAERLGSCRPLAQSNIPLRLRG